MPTDMIVHMDTPPASVQGAIPMPPTTKIERCKKISQCEIDSMDTGVQASELMRIATAAAASDWIARKKWRTKFPLCLLDAAHCNVLPHPLLAMGFRFAALILV
jgi:hypothetical protein